MVSHPKNEMGGILNKSILHKKIPTVSELIVSMLLTEFIFSSKNKREVANN